MQFSIFINQARAVEWGLNAQQTLLFAYLYSVPSWATPVHVEGLVYYRLDKTKVISDLPILTDKVDTVYRLLRQLVEAGLVDMAVSENRSVIRLTEVALEWNHTQIVPAHPGSKIDQNIDESVPTGSDNFPSGSEKNPSRVGKKSEPGSEKNPTNSSLYINNPIIKLNTNSQSTYQDSPRDVPDDDLQVAEEFFESLLLVNPCHKKPNLETWARCIRLMRERDGRTVAQIRYLWKWARGDPFWQSNILSPEKLRKQFDALVVKIKTERDRRHAEPRAGARESSSQKFDRQVREVLAECEAREASDCALDADETDLRAEMVEPGG